MVPEARGRPPAPAAWLAGRLDRTRPTGFALTLTAVAGAVCAWIFAVLAQDVHTGTGSVRFDPVVERFVVAHRTPWLTPLMHGATLLGSAWVLVPLLSLAAFVMFRRTRSWWPGGQLATASLGVLVLVHVVKDLVNRPRPPVSLIGEPFGSSFPSGHSAQGVAAWGMLAVVLTTGCRSRTRILAGAGAGVIALAIGASRIYLGAHWLTDVLGGYTLAGTWLAAVIALRLSVSAFAARAPALAPSPPEE